MRPCWIWRRGTRGETLTPGGSLTRTTLGGLFWMFLGTGAQAVLQLLVLVILARLLTPADFGLVSAAMVVVGFSSIFSQLGVGPAIVQRAQLESRHLRTGFTVSVVFGACMMCLTWLMAGNAAAFFRIDSLASVMRAMSVVFLCQGMSVVAESLVQRDLHFRQLACIEVVAFAVGFGAVGVTLAVMGFGVWALVWAHLSQNGLKTAILLVFRRHPKRPMVERRALEDLIYFGGGFTVARIGNYFGVQGDNLVVGRWLGAEALGVYGRAYQLMASPAMFVGQILDRVLFPAMAKVQESSDRLTAVYRRGVALIALVMMPVSAALYVLAPEVVRILLGPGWSATVTPFRIFALGMLFRTSYKMSDSLARATGAVYRRAWRQWVYALLVIGGAWLGTAWGLSGVTLCVLAAIAVNFLLMAQLSLRLVAMTWRSFLTAHVPAAALGLILGLEIWAAATLLRSWDLGALEVLAVSGTVYIISALVLLRLLPQVVLGQDGIWMVRTLAAYLPEAGYLQRAVGGIR